MYEIDICCSDRNCNIDIARLTDAIHQALRVEGVERAVLSVSIVDNATMHRLNLKHLKHDYPTDVISFQLDWDCPTADLQQRLAEPCKRSDGASVEGEIIIGSEYAAEMAERVDWSVQDELTLYAVHGLLHICGYDDLTTDEKNYMRSREGTILRGLGLSPQYPDDQMASEACSEETR